MGQLAEERYDAVVVGTGFGGAVAACRLAQAGVRVGVIERGRRFPPGSFPARHEALAWQLGGPYDIKPLQSIAVVQAAGYGGGSLIYANVQMRAAHDLFREGWPASYSREALDPDYDLVAHMLDIKPIEADPATGALPMKTVLVEAAAERLGRGDQAFRPNLAVNFAGPGEEPRPNRFGALQSGCIHCGRCDVGCNVGAKNTLDLNYLAAAEAAGADVAVQAELEWLAPEPGGYRLRYRDREAGIRREVSAAEVYLCMGAVNTTEFLMRCREQFRTLPNLSGRLGHSYSSNGDFFAFGLGPASGFAATRGPTITVAMTYDGGDTSNPLRFTLEEGGYRKELAALLPLLSPSRLVRLLRRRRGAGSLVARMAAEGDGTIMFLVMGRDRSDGKLELSRLTRRLKVRWDRAANAALYEAEAAACRELIRELGGTMRLAPNWRLFGQPSTVHNLGGCAMGADPGEGVVDPLGEVFGYPGLRVLDGSIIPRAIGVNPSHTIAAVAERCVRHAIRRRPGLGEWTAPEAAAAPRRRVPEDAARMRPPPLAASTGRRNVALRWSERMRGACSAGENRRAVDLRLTVDAGSASAFVADRDHRADVSGTVTVAGLVDGVAVEGGHCNLFVDQGVEGELAMTYVLPFRLTDGTLGVLEGRKRVRGRWPWDFWRATTTMAVKVTAEGEPELAGNVGLDLADVWRMGLSLRAAGSGSRRRNLAGLLSFLGFFAANLLRLARTGLRPSP